ncbi:hypothetical protein [Leptotrichia shahii]|jgi:membrane protein|uniref:hypothetical protein n=1 Tax=Leptotrichia shahii TaxID=157691 RepID=UPI0028D15C11|nr:hypothetical protein [Leptotrichia shahii]
MFGVKKNKEKNKVYSINILQKIRSDMNFLNFVIYKDNLQKFGSIIASLLYSFFLYDKFKDINDFKNSGWLWIIFVFIIYILLIVMSILLNTIRFKTSFNLKEIDKKLKRKFKIILEKDFEINNNKKKELLEELKRKREILENKKFLFSDTVKFFFSIVPFAVIILNVTNNLPSEEKIAILIFTIIIVFFILFILHLIFHRTFLSSREIEIEQLNEIQEYLEEKNEVEKKISTIKNKLIKWSDNELKKFKINKYIVQEKIGINKIQEYLKKNNKDIVIKELKEYFKGDKEIAKELNNIRSIQKEYLDYEDFEKYIPQDKVKVYFIIKIKKIKMDLKFDFENIYAIKEFKNEILITIPEKIIKTLNNEKKIEKEKDIYILLNEKNEFKIEENKKNLVHIIILTILLLVLLIFSILPNFKINNINNVLKRKEINLEINNIPLEKEITIITSSQNNILNNLSNKEIIIKMNSKEISIPPHSIKKVEFRNGKSNLEFKKCKFSMSSDLKGGVINLTDKKCFVISNNQDSLEFYPKEHKYLFNNLTEKEIGITTDSKNYYKIKPFRSIELNLKNGNYKLKDNCEIDVKYSSEGGVINIDENNCKIIEITE